MPWTFDKVMYIFFHEYEQGVDEFLGYCTGCHAGGDDGAPRFPRSTPEEFHTYLLSAHSEYCHGHPMVTPGEPDKSALALSLVEGQCERDRMPLGDPWGLYPEEVEGVRSWIAAGAKL